MSWKKSLLPASFRKVNFFVTSHSMTVGRRVISHEFPFGENSLNDDMGRKTRSFQLEGFLIGETYLKNRNQIVDACEMVGEGLLVHPYLGQMKVNCRSLSIRETQDDGGMAHLNFDFVESKKSLITVVDTDKLGKVTSAMQLAIQNALDNFKDAFEVVKTVKSGIKKAKEAIAQQMDNLSQAQKICADVAQTGNDLAQLVSEASNAIDRIVMFPEKVAGLFEASFATLSNSIDKSMSKTDNKGISAALIRTFGLGSFSLIGEGLQVISGGKIKNDPSVDAKRILAWANLTKQKIKQPQILNSTSKESLTEKRNKEIMELTFNTVALSYLAVASSTSNYSCADDAVDTRNLVLSLADDILSHPLITDDLFSSVQDLQSAVHESILSIENTLPVIQSFLVPKTTNLLCFLYEKFGSLEKEEEVISRNNLRDPSFIPANTILKVAV